MKRETEDGYRRTNREMMMEPRSLKSSWCMVCDACLVLDGQRCPVCGHKDESERAKKIVVRD